jgi:hypothetical protein
VADVGAGFSLANLLIPFATTARWTSGEFTILRRFL